MTRPLVIVLTGCASGIGQHLAGVLAQQGHFLLATDMNLEALEMHARKVGWNPPQVLLRQLDVRNADGWKETIQMAVDTWGRIDVLLNVAGVLKPGYIHETPAEMVDFHIDTNVKGVIHGTRAAAEQMVKQRHGHIINMASLAGVAPIPGLNLYSASKYAVRGFSLAVAQELRPHGVYVTAICPDAVQTPMLDLQMYYNEAVLTFSGGRFLTVEDIGKVITGRVLEKRPLEVLLPFSRGVLAKIVNTFPGLAMWVTPIITRKGKARQEMIKKQRGIP